jgi:hypothetical protein
VIGGGGRDIIDGGAGTDTAVFPGSQGTYSLFVADDYISVFDRSQPNGDPTTLRNVERIAFSQDPQGLGDTTLDISLFDGMAQLDGASMAALTELYIAYFNRAPDALGLFFWGDQLAQGASLDEIAGAFFDQPETRALYGGMDDMSNFVTTVYENVLGRTPDAQGMAYWLSLLERDGGVQPSSFIQAIIAGAKSETGDPADAAYLANKVQLGGHFAITRGLSDRDAAQTVMQGFDGSDTSLADGVRQIDAFYTDALAADDGTILMQLVGVSDAPFGM